MSKITKQYLLPLVDKKKTQVALLSLGAEIEQLKFLRKKMSSDFEFEVYVQSWKQTPWKNAGLELVMFPREEYLQIVASESTVKQIMKELELCDCIESCESVVVDRYHRYCKKTQNEPKNIVSFKSRS